MNRSTRGRRPAKKAGTPLSSSPRLRANGQRLLAAGLHLGNPRFDIVDGAGNVLGDAGH